MTRKFRRGLVALSADPITNGHLDIIERAAGQCEHLIVAVMNNDAKAGKYLFTDDERLQIARRAVTDRGCANVGVTASSGLLTDFYLKFGCDALFRGVRNPEDRRYEREQIRVLATILPRIEAETRYLEARPHLRHVSSSTVKLLVQHHVDVSELVPTFVKAELESRLVHQIKIGVTGGMAVGKTTVAERLVSLARRNCRVAHHLNVDQLIRDLYDETSEGARLLRRELERLLGKGVLLAASGLVDRRVLAERLFAPTLGPAVFEEVMELTTPHVERKYREALKNKIGLIVVEWAQMAEMSMSKWVNHRVIVVDSPDRARFAAKRCITPEQLKRVVAKQWSADRKTAALEENVTKAKFGAILTYANRWRDSDDDAEDDIAGLYREVVDCFMSRSV